MADTQSKRYQRIVSYFEEIYKREGKWSSDSGTELMHEAYMGNYCLTLYDSDRRVVWGMDPTDLKNRLHLNAMMAKGSGVYNTQRFEIKSGDKIAGYVDIGQYSSLLMSEDDINFKSSVNKSIIASGILTLAVIIVLSLYFSKGFSTPIREVAELSVNLSRGKFNTKSNTGSNIEEIEKLRRSINILAEKLKTQDTLRKRLVSDISHEIRTPLNVLQNNLEAMVDGVLPVTKERMSSLNEEVIRFGRLLNNLNALKEFESESATLEFEYISLDELIKDIYNDFYLDAENKNIRMCFNIDTDSDYHMNGDKDKLKQVFINIISNAVKFTEKNGEVRIDLRSNSENITVEIKDNGIGISKEDLPFIFERLYRGDKSRGQTEGSGIGLTIVKNILQLHNASIDVESKEGEGTAFKVTFIKSGNIL
jgi:signal transduction histidine kinase